MKRNHHEQARVLFFLFLILPSFILGYYFDGGLYKFSSSTFLIVLFTILFYPKNWKELLGLQNSKKWLPLGILFCVIFYYLSHYLIELSLNLKGYHLVKHNLVDYSLVPFQSLNEEFLFRSMLLFGMLKLGIEKWKAVLIPSAAFSIFHWIFYKFNLYPPNRGEIEYTTLITLFMFGIAASLLFLSTRNIALPWSLHCGWNLNRFGSIISQISDTQNKGIAEFESFNLLEGSINIMLISIALAGFSVYFYVRQEKSQKSQKSQKSTNS